MQEVFEKIIEKLEEENSRLKRLRNNCIALSDSEVSAIENKAYNFSIEIVKQEAEKYNNGHFGCNTNGEHEKCNGCGLTDCKNRNKIWFGVSDDNNGWIPCSERLPEKYNRVLAYTDAGGYYIAHVNGCGKFVCTAECVSTVIENSDVIVWQPLPQPYQPKGE